MAELCNEVVATIADDFVLAVDDVHALASGPAAAALGLLAQDLPPNAHMALASRTVLPFSLTRLWSAGVMEIGEGALALSEQESAELLDLARVVVEPEMIPELHRRTEGWVAGLLLAGRTGTGPVDPRGSGAGPQFDYLAEEVFGRLPIEMQDFLLDTAVLERFSAGLADAMTGRRNGDKLIDQLRAQHLFTIPVNAEGEWYRYHHLFHAFLRRRVARRGPEALADLHRRAGRGWMSAGDRAEAVRHFLEADDFGRAVEALEPVAERMVQGPEAETVAGWLDAIPGELWAGRPSLILAHAALLLTRAQHEESFAAFEHAIDELLEVADHERAATVLFRLLQSMVTAGTRPERRITTGQRYLPRIDPDRPHAAGCPHPPGGELRLRRPLRGGRARARGRTRVARGRRSGRRSGPTRRSSGRRTSRIRSAGARRPSRTSTRPPPTSSGARPTTSSGSCPSPTSIAATS